MVVFLLPDWNGNVPVNISNWVEQRIEKRQEQSMNSQVTIAIGMLTIVGRAWEMKKTSN